MRKELQTPFSTRQYMLSRDFELYYYSDTSLKSVAGHTHDYYEFYFFLEGNVSLKIAEEQYTITYGDMVLIPPNVQHLLIRHDSAIPYRRFVFWITPQFLSRLMEADKDYGYLIQLAEVRKCYIFHHDRVIFNSIQSKILRLLEEMQSQRFGRSAQISLCVNDLLLHLNRLTYDREHTGAQSETHALYQTISAFIEAHVEEDLSLERLSREFFVSKYHIAHVFKDNLGLSIHQYITKKRLELCRQAILSNMSITEAYQTFGFGDYSSFFRAFKREYGISPRAFRDMKFIEEH